MHGTRKRRRASRWMLLKVNDELRSKKLDDTMGFYENHGYSKLKIGTKEVTPAEQMKYQRIIAVRIYSGGPYTAIVNLAYYYHYGAHRCNLAQYSEFGEAVYCYTDITTTLRSIETSNVADRTKCIGLIS